MSTELIPTRNAVINGETVNAVNARELYRFLGNKRGFSHWIANRIDTYGFVQGVDYEVLGENAQNPSGGRPIKEYAITLDMAKELAMVENNAQGRKARQYFIEVEKRYRTETVDVRKIAEAIMPVLEERAELKAKLDFARNFLPLGNPGELNRRGEVKTQFRRGYYCSGKGRSITALVERLDQPGLFDEIELKQLSGSTEVM